MSLSSTEQQRTAAKHFSEHWKDKGYEKGESQPFWLSFLRDVYGVEHPEEMLLANLPTEYYRLSFLTDTGNAHLKHEMEVSMQAGENGRATSKTCNSTGNANYRKQTCGFTVDFDATE